MARVQRAHAFSDVSKTLFGGDSRSERRSWRASVTNRGSLGSDDSSDRDLDAIDDKPGDDMTISS